mgnify:CR=1 FL=1
MSSYAGLYKYLPAHIMTCWRISDLLTYIRTYWHISGYTNVCNSALTHAAPSPDKPVFSHAMIWQKNEACILFSYSRLRLVVINKYSDQQLLSAHKCSTFRLRRYHSMCPCHIDMLCCTVLIIIITALNRIADDICHPLRLTFACRCHSWASAFAE